MRIPYQSSCLARRLTYLCLCATVGCGFLVLAAVPAAAGAAEAVKQVTFTKDIAPILQRSCETCHRDGGGAPMALVAYEDVRPWARSIKNRTARPDTDPDRMPPWYIEKTVGIQDFKDDPSLSPEEIALIVDWVDSGAPRGDLDDRPPPLEWPDADVWTIGEPDLIVTSPVITVRAQAPDWWGPVGPFPSGATEDRYVKAVEVKEVWPPGTPRCGGPGSSVRGEGVCARFKRVSSRGCGRHSSRPRRDTRCCGC